MPIGRVTKSTGSWYSVLYEKNIYECKIRGKFRIEGIRTTNPIAVGDKVRFNISGDVPMIDEILPRTNYIVRKATKLSSKSHIIASNIDQAILVVTPRNPDTPIAFIDRFLVSANAYNVPVVIVFNKADTFTEEDQDWVAELMATYSEINYQVIHTSATQNIGIKNIIEILKDKISVVSGNSGVGKSSLIKAIDENLHVKIQEISDIHKQGKHTTSFAQMYELKTGGYIIDTPGIRAFGLIDLDKNEIWHYFPEMLEIGQNCRFTNCTHTHEPGCKVIEAVENGDIALSRYESYINIHTSDEDKFRKDKYN